MNLIEYLPSSLQQDHPKFKLLTDGLSGSQIYEIRCDHGRYILRINRPEDSDESWQRHLTYQLQAAKLGIAPEVLSSDFERRFVLSRYIEQHSIISTLRGPHTRQSIIQDLVKILQGIHQLPKEEAPSQTNTVDRILEFYKQQQKEMPLPSLVQEAYRVFASINQKKFYKGENLICLCHRDLNPSNFLYDGNQVWVIDWEDAANDNPYYDIATMVNYWALTDEDGRVLLDLYLERGASDDEWQCLNFYRLLMALEYTIILFKLSGLFSRPDYSIPELDELPTMDDCFDLIEEGRFDLTTASHLEMLGLAHLSRFYSVLASLDPSLRSG